MSPQHLRRHALRSIQGATLLRSQACSSYAGRISHPALVTSTMIPTWSRRAMTHEAFPKAPSHEAQNTFPQLKEFDLRGRVFVVTGGGRGLGLSMAEALMEAGGKVWCLDRLEEPDDEFLHVQSRASQGFNGSLHYDRIDVRDVKAMESTISRIAADKCRLDGLIAAAGIQQVQAALDYSVEDIQKMLDINYTGVFMTATTVAREMMKYKTRGSILLVASMSGLIANKGLVSPVYNSSKAAVIQLGRNLAMEWGKVREDGSGGIRVNSLCPGHIVTPMVKENFEKEPWLKEMWEKENMLGRLSSPEEFRGAALYMLSDASTFMTGTSFVIDGGHTAW
ncbi:alcohol dehydrogenase protein [Rutstroemia sp. NJR-2017a WRK4]|nr:alcohol dehydrogenase protein [Rutstroemia sp. NJR-2017a WRK4]